MTRILWIVGLCFALFVYGGITVGIVFVLVKHRHLNRTGFLMLLGNGYVAWITLQYLRLKVSGPRPTPSPAEKPVEIPRLW